jgi:flagellar motor switch protein FliG
LCSGSIAGQTPRVSEPLGGIVFTGLDGLGVEDPVFARDVRKAIFTFKDIALRVKPTDIPICIKSVDAAVLTTAIAAALALDDAHVASADFILGSISQRMAGQLHEDASERGSVRKADAVSAMSKITKAMCEMVDGGTITLRDPDDEEQAA